MDCRYDLPFAGELLECKHSKQQEEQQLAACENCLRAETVKALQKIDETLSYIHTTMVK